VKWSEDLRVRIQCFPIGEKSVADDDRATSFRRFGAGVERVVRLGSVCYRRDVNVATITVEMLFASAPLLNGSCAVDWYSETSVSFTWSRATSAADVTYHLSDGTTVLANTTTTSATVENLAAGANYYYSLYAITSGSNSRSESVYCTGWTGE
jgi:hypothetical protein